MNIMKFKCKTCKYETDRRSSYDLHLETIKHIKNTKAKRKVDSDDVVVELTREKEQLAMDREKMAKDLALAEKRAADAEKQILLFQVENLKEQLKLKDECTKTVIVAKDECIKVKDESLKSFQKIAETTSATVKSSCDTLNFLVENFKNATRITDHKLTLKDDTTGKYKDLYIKIAYNAKHKRLAQFIVEIIEDVYLSGKPVERPFCVTDTSRNTYWTRLENWQKDSKGTKIKKFFIKPILKVILNEARKFNKAAPKQLENEEDPDKRESILYNQKWCADAVSQIGSGELEDAVLRKLADVCQLDKKNLRIGKDNKGPIIEEVRDDVIEPIDIDKVD